MADIFYSFALLFVGFSVGFNICIVWENRRDRKELEERIEARKRERK